MNPLLTAAYRPGGHRPLLPAGVQIVVGGEVDVVVVGRAVVGGDVVGGGAVVGGGGAVTVGTAGTVSTVGGATAATMGGARPTA